MSLLPEKLKPLYTKEDTFHIHKTLGILCLLSFITRFSMIFFAGDYDIGFTKYPQWTIPTVILHLLLNVSSFEFKIPARRISSGYRIWPQYRAHALIFTCFLLATITLYWYEQGYQTGPHHIFNSYLFPIMTRIFADLGSSYYGDKYKSDTIRGFPTPNYVKFFFSYIQLFGSVYFFFGPRKYALPFMGVMVIQGNAFLMTLRRKNIAGHFTLIFIYGLSLFLALAVGINELSTFGPYALPLVVSLGHLATFLRLNDFFPKSLSILQNKYFIWTLIGLTMNSLRPILDAEGTVSGFSPRQAWTVCALATTGILVTGWHKCKYGYKQNHGNSSNGATAGVATKED